jgi:hypothetical protein
MPRFQERAPEARGRVVRSSKGSYQERQVYRENLGKLDESHIWEVVPERGESLRWIKLNIRRAGKDLNMKLGYGETREGTLLVWCEAPRERRQRGRPRKVTSF